MILPFPSIYKSLIQLEGDGAMKVNGEVNTQISTIPIGKVTKRKMSKDRLLSVLFLLPSIILIAIFVYGFIGWSGYVSLSNWNSIVKDLSFAGFKNYAYLFDHFRFQADLRNTFFFTVLFIGVVIIVGQLLAILIDQQIKGESFFRNVFLSHVIILYRNGCRLAMAVKSDNGREFIFTKIRYQTDVVCRHYDHSCLEVGAY